jgi:hypothetical protein
VFDAAGLVSGMAALLQRPLANPSSRLRSLRWHAKLPNLVSESTQQDQRLDEACIGAVLSLGLTVSSFILASISSRNAS